MFALNPRWATALSTLALAVSLGILSMPAADAAANSRAAVINVNTTGVNSTLPPIQAQMSEDLLMQVNNNLSTPVSLDIPTLGIRYPIAAASSQTFYVDLARLNAANTPFLIRDASGNVISTGQIALADFPGMMTASDRIDTNTAYSYERKPEPVYYTQTQPARKPYVRGYW